MKYFKILLTKKLFLVCLSVLLMSSMCSDDKDCHSIKIINNSSKTIYFKARAYDFLDEYSPLYSMSYKVSINSINDFSYSPQCAEDFFNETGKLYFFIFDEQVLLNNTWEKVKTDNLVLKRYSFALQEMQVANWTIIYDDN